jgi:YmgG-like glycine-zipper protein
MADQRVEAGQLEEEMRKLNVVMIGLAMVGLAACDRGQNANKMASDTALSRDLNLANQAQPFQGLDSMSALETARQAEAAPLGAAPIPRSTASSVTPTRRTASSARRSTRTYPTSTRRRSTSSGRSSTTASGDIGTRSEGRVVVKKNTRRDAAIGAGAGAVIGAVTSRNKVKGAVIGGVAGGVIGAIIGNNVDVKKTRVP